MFDCVLPTRLGRTGSALTWEGRSEPPQRRFARDPAPLQEVPLPRVLGLSRAYLRHLVNQQELLGLVLLSEHNVRFLLDLTAGARAVERGELAAFKQDALGGSKADRRTSPATFRRTMCVSVRLEALRGSGPGWLRQPARRLGKWIQSSSSSS